MWSGGWWSRFRVVGSDLRPLIRLVRVALATLAVLAAVAAWPQDAGPPPLDHSQHPVINTPADGPVPSLIVHMDRDAVDGYNIYLETSNFRFTPENAGAVAIANEGHAHLYLNGTKVARIYSPWRHLPLALFRDGINRLQVELNANDHSVWGVAGEPIGTDVLVDTRSTDADPIVREEVRYTLSWDWSRVERRAGGGWSVVSDLGYHVRVDGGQVVTRGLELVPCHAMTGMAAMAAVPRWLGPRIAAAGHGSMLPNASRIADSHLEDLANPTDLALEPRVVTDPEYCEAHYLIARPRGTGPGTTALALHGRWSRSAAGPWQEFAASSAGAYGEIKELRHAEDGDAMRRMIVGGVDVRVLRSVAALVDGLDFASAKPQGLGRAALRSLVRSTRIVAGVPSSSEP